MRKIEKLKTKNASKVEFSFKDEIYATFNTLEQVIRLIFLEDGITIRRVVIEWKKSKDKKNVVKEIGNAMKSQYDKDDISQHNKSFSNILTEINDLI